MTDRQSHPASILVIEDEAPIRKFLRASLTSRGYHLREAENGREGQMFLTAEPPDLVILDLGLPDMDGLDIIKSLREWSQVPVIILSARGQEKDKVAALELGADDYVTKPFGVSELLARIQVALRHARARGTMQEPVFEHDGLKVDSARRQVWVEGAEIKLTPTEYKLLSILVQYAGKVVTHSQLLREVWGKHANEEGHHLRIYVQHLRQKLGDRPIEPRYILTETGIGYRLISE